MVRPGPEVGLGICVCVGLAQRGGVEGGVGGKQHRIHFQGIVAAVLILAVSPSRWHFSSICLSPAQRSAEGSARSPEWCVSSQRGCVNKNTRLAASRASVAQPYSHPFQPPQHTSSPQRTERALRKRARGRRAHAVPAMAGGWRASLLSSSSSAQSLTRCVTTRPTSCRTRRRRRFCSPPQCG
ncbi:hypothetical protein JKP88DRAFT_230192 [Tribonema minus]|uniref:Uncharacterized protein n=1 Tax=Tribonema minus TaxID=303371 RepID=A0A835ZEN4_9STRA|nr:hypothetical protein JKP88DRAFT_230192 [Tribonema minus]